MDRAHLGCREPFCSSSFAHRPLISLYVGAGSEGVDAVRQRTRWSATCGFVATVLVLIWVGHGMWPGSTKQSTAASAEQAAQCWASALRWSSHTVTLYRPSWLPDAFYTARVSCTSTTTSGPVDLTVSYEVGSSKHVIAISVENNDANVTPSLLTSLHTAWTIPARVGGKSGTLLIQHGDEPKLFVWLAGHWRYAVEARDTSLDDLLHVVSNLLPA